MSDFLKLAEAPERRPISEERDRLAFFIRAFLSQMQPCLYLWQSYGIVFEYFVQYSDLHILMVCHIKPQAKHS